MARGRLRNSLCAATAIIFLSPVAARVVQGWICRIGSKAIWDYGPSIRAIRLRMFLDGIPLYTDFRRLPYQFPNPYNPLAYYAAAALTPLFGHGAMAPLEAGRLLVICSTLIVCLLIFKIARREGAGSAAAAIVVLMFVLSPLLQPWGFAFRVDMPALAFDLGGICLFSMGLPYHAVGLFLAASLTKQMRLAGIAAAVLYSWLSGRQRQAVALAGSGWPAWSSSQFFSSSCTRTICSTPSTL